MSFFQVKLLGASPVAQWLRICPPVQETQESHVKEMATHSSILAWEIPWTGTWQATVHGVAKSQIRLSD